MRELGVGEHDFQKRKPVFSWSGGMHLFEEQLAESSIYVENVKLEI